VVSVAREGGAVRVDFMSAPSKTYNLVVGADGAHSVVRSAVTAAAARPSLMTASSWRFMIDNPGVDCWTPWSGASGTLLLIPVDDAYAYGYASATRGTGVSDDPAWLAATFASFASPVPEAVEAALEHPTDLYYSAVDDILCDRWSLDRLVLIGDAAHAMGPVWPRAPRSRWRTRSSSQICSTGPTTGPTWVRPTSSGAGSAWRGCKRPPLG
jgi:2-polyprenyl-6-methoxyphenol hydroxylase-like FAD-dependent oxidoreductase